MFVKPDRAQVIVAACCTMHNYLIQTKDESYCPQGFADILSDRGEIIEGSWRNQLQNGSMYHTRLRSWTPGRLPENAKEMRNWLKEYVNSEGGEVPWEII
jgi:hypothetical protein